MSDSSNDISYLMRNTANLLNEQISHLKMPTINNDLLKPARNYQHADYQYEVIIERIKEFEDSLDEEHEVALKLSSFGQSITLSVTDIGYSNPSILTFHGLVGDSCATLIQHVSQLSFLLLSVKKANPEAPPRRIGFERD